MYVIDGHNLIPKIPGLSLKAIDDELLLIDLLVTFAQARRKPIEVFFDGAPAGWAGRRRYGALVTAHFVSLGKTADEAIRQFLATKGKSARGLIVVSSDRQVQANARALYAQVTPSEMFAQELLNCRDAAGAARKMDAEKGSAAAKNPKEAQRDGEPSSAEIQEWLDLFGEAPDFPDQPVKRKKKAERGSTKRRKTP